MPRRRLAVIATIGMLALASAACGASLARIGSPERLNEEQLAVLYRLNWVADHLQTAVTAAGRGDRERALEFLTLARDSLQVARTGHAYAAHESAFGQVDADLATAIAVLGHDPQAKDGALTAVRRAQSAFYRLRGALGGDGGTA